MPSRRGAVSTNKDLGKNGTIKTSSTQNVMCNLPLKLVNEAPRGKPRGIKPDFRIKVYNVLKIIHKEGGKRYRQNNEIIICY